MFEAMRGSTDDLPIFIDRAMDDGSPVSHVVVRRWIDRLQLYLIMSVI